jgi:hypothetical protein
MIPETNRAEYLAEFRSGLGENVRREAVEACIICDELAHWEPGHASPPAGSTVANNETDHQP